MIALKEWDTRIAYYNKLLLVSVARAARVSSSTARHISNVLKFPLFGNDLCDFFVENLRNYVPSLSTRGNINETNMFKNCKTLLMSVNYRVGRNY